MESVDLASELEDAIYTYFELFRQEGIEVSYKGPDEDVPPIVADSERMKQVFCNVLDNSCHGFFLWKRYNKKQRTPLAKYNVLSESFCACFCEMIFCQLCPNF